MKKLTLWLGSFLLLSIIFGTIFGCLQQSLRQNANDPQIQLASDAAAALDDGKTPSSVMGGAVNVRSSLAPFVIVYNKQGRVIIGDGYLDGIVPTIPVGVLNSANGRIYHAVTWQPQPGVRIAAVAVSGRDYFVVSGRSLREIESRTDQLSKMVGAGWLASVVTVSVTVYLCQPRGRDTKQKIKSLKSDPAK